VNAREEAYNQRNDFVEMGSEQLDVHHTFGSSNGQSCSDWGIEIV